MPDISSTTLGNPDLLPRKADEDTVGWMQQRTIRDTCVIFFLYSVFMFTVDEISYIGSGFSLPRCTCQKILLFNEFLIRGWNGAVCTIIISSFSYKPCASYKVVYVKLYCVNFQKPCKGDVKYSFCISFFFFGCSVNAYISRDSNQHGLHRKKAIYN